MIITFDIIMFFVVDDEFAEVAIHLPPEDTPVMERKSSLSRKSKERSSSVTFQEGVKSAGGKTSAEGHVKGLSTERKQLRGAESLLEADEEKASDMRFVILVLLKLLKLW